MNNIRIKELIFCILSVLFMVSCDPNESKEEEVDVEEPTPSEEIAKATTFASDVFQVYYLWNEEVSKSIQRLDPDTCFYPKAVVKEIRYHENGKEVDRWTTLTDDLSSMTNYVQGLGVTYGYELEMGKISNQDGVYFLLVSLVYKDSPAEKAGLKRGDVITQINGSKITSSNYSQAFSSTSISLGVSDVEKDETTGSYYIGSKVTTVQMTAEDMYTDPILVSKTFDLGTKKVGYLFYNSFDLTSCKALPTVFSGFKEAGVTEMIVDLRYNTGGYAFTENVLGSLIAPMANVKAGDVFQTEIYNSNITAAWKKYNYDTNTYFSLTHEYGSGSTGFTVDLSDVKPEISKVYYIVTGSSASASEGLIVGLGPYVDQTLIGQQTYGKYCAGFMLDPASVYNSTYDYSLIKDWGIYVMVSKFADKDGNNEAMPDGIPVDMAAEDNPLDGFQIGDENETMLKVALQAAGKLTTKSAAVDAPEPGLFKTEPIEHGAPAGMLIKTFPKTGIK